MSNSLVVQQATPAALLQTAIEKGVDMQQLKELMDLQERWEKKEARKQFFEALSKFQTLVPALKKNKTANVPTKTGSQFSYKFADLGSIASGIKNALNECGLSYRWEFAESKEGMKVTCIVSHLSGHSEMTSMEAGKDISGAKNDIQSKGSTNTYLQRYTLIGALGLATADDDKDAAGAAPASRSRTSQPQSADLSEDEYLDLWRQKLKEVNTKMELNKLYAVEQKKILADEKLKAMFKDRQEELKASENKVASPVNQMA